MINETGVGPERLGFFKVPSVHANGPARTFPTDPANAPANNPEPAYFSISLRVIPLVITLLVFTIIGIINFYK
jgi:hypothetical protein